MAIKHLRHHSKSRLHGTPHAGEVKKKQGPPPLQVVEAPPEGKVNLEAKPAKVTMLPTRGVGGVTEYYEGKHHAEGERTPRDSQYLTETTVRVPKLADFATQGLSHLEKSDLKPIYDRDVTITRPDGTTARINLMKAKNDSVAVDDFYLVLEEIMKAQVFSLGEDHARDLGVGIPPGADHVDLLGSTVLAVIDKTIDEAVALADKVPPEAAPIPKGSPMRENFLKMLRRFAIQATFHAKDLTTVHVAMGHDPKKEKQLNETMRHDLVEWAPLKDLVWELERRPHDPWMDNWLKAEVSRQRPELLADNPSPRVLYERVKADDALTFNVSALNPRNLVAMFRWGDSREDCNVLIDPHRLSPHHNGSSKTDVDFQQRAINFLSHHMPREHMGVRHMQRGEWDSVGPDGKVVPFGSLEAAFKTDNAIRNSEVLQQIARDGARFFRAAEEKGYTVPWQKLKVPGRVEFVQLDHAYETLQANNAAADDTFAEKTAAATAASKRASAAASLAAGKLLEGLESLTPQTPAAQLDAIEAGLAELLKRATTAADRELAADVVYAAVARFTELTPGSVAATETFAPRAERIEDALYAFDPKLAPRDGRLFIAADTARQLRVVLEQLLPAARQARLEEDSSTAQVYEDWNELLTGGMVSTAH